MLRIITIVGARPQFVKAATVTRALALTNDVHEELVHTGQHYDHDMSAVFFDELGIPAPHRDLAIGSGTHGRQTGRMLEAIEAILLEDPPDLVLVYGDTNSTLAGALAAVKLHVPLAHVEAGLRSFDRRMPEEVNRVLTDHAADLLFAPTDVAVANLRAEGVDDARVHLVGDVMLDAALHFAERADAEAVGRHAGVDLRARYALATVHRAENTDDRARLEAILLGLGALARELPVVLPLHPRTRRAIEELELAALLEALHVIAPVGYLEMVALERSAALILTDSGGVQKEAYFFGVPCVTLRASTEWTETVAARWNRLVDPLTAEGIVGAAQTALHTRPEGAPSFYGTGDAAEAIAAVIVDGAWRRPARAGTSEGTS